jgi:hypothetical protein
MSGGSYNYLYGATSLDELLAKRHVLQEMADRLAGLDEAEFPGATAAARETAYLLNLLRVWDNHTEARTRLVSDVWHAVEWWDSSDYGPDQVREALAKLVDPTPPPSPPAALQDGPDRVLSIPEEWKAPSPRLAPPSSAPAQPPKPGRPPFRDFRDPWPTDDDGASS